MAALPPPTRPGRLIAEPGARGSQARLPPGARGIFQFEERGFHLKDPWPRAKPHQAPSPPCDQSPLSRRLAALSGSSLITEPCGSPCSDTHQSPGGALCRAPRPGPSAPETHQSRSRFRPDTCRRRARWRAPERGLRGRPGPHGQGAFLEWGRPIVNKWTSESIPEGG